MIRITAALFCSVAIVGQASAQFQGGGGYPPNWGGGYGGYPPYGSGGYGSGYGGGPGNPQAGMPGQPPMFGPRTQQPALSPYLNLFGGAGGIPAVNYYNAIRPMLQGQGQTGMGMMYRSPSGGMSQQQYGYLPQAGLNTREPVPLSDPAAEVVLPPSGHPVTYGNPFGQSRTGPSRNGFFPQPPTGQSQRPPAQSGAPAPKK